MDLSQPPDPERLLDEQRFELNIRIPRNMTEAQAIATIFGALNGTRTVLCDSVVAIPPRKRMDGR
jgi:hypothetical protein